MISGIFSHVIMEIRSGRSVRCIVFVEGNWAQFLVQFCNGTKSRGGPFLKQLKHCFENLVTSTAQLLLVVSSVDWS